ncbi:MAG: CBS domain-containing protein [Bdellovibrionota bacterium]
MDLRKIGKRKVATVYRDTSVGDAARFMRESHLGDVVVIDRSDGKIVPIGILTDRDIVMSTTALRMSPFDFKVEDVMTKSLVTAQSNASLTQIISLMKEHGIKRIPLVNEVGELDAIVAIEDVIRLLAEELFALSQVYERQQDLEQVRRRRIS